MPNSLEQVCCARLAVSALGVLAELRRTPGIRVTPAGDDGFVWVHWEGGNTAVLRRLLPVPGVDLYTRRDGLWYRPSAHLPSFAVPEEVEAASIPLVRAVTPRPVQPLAPSSDPPQPARLGLAREATPREATALRCALTDLACWAEHAVTAQLTALEGAWTEEAEEGEGVLLVLGQRLPPIAGDRFWGDRLLVPLGWRPEPDLCETALRRALEVAEAELVVLEADGFEVIPRSVFEPLTRARVRLARAQASSSTAAPADAEGGPPG
jgi:hypothetical protein